MARNLWMYAAPERDYKIEEMPDFMLRAVFSESFKDERYARQDLGDFRDQIVAECTKRELRVTRDWYGY